MRILKKKPREVVTTYSTEIEGLIALHNAVEMKLNMLVDASTALESKLAVLFAGTLAVSTIILTKAKNLNDCAIVGLYLLCVSMIFSVVGSLPRTYPSSAIKVSNHPNYLKMKSRHLLLQLISNNEKSVKRVQDINEEKVLAYIASGISFILGSALTLGAFYLKIPKV